MPCACLSTRERRSQSRSTFEKHTTTVSTPERDPWLTAPFTCSPFLDLSQAGDDAKWGFLQIDLRRQIRTMESSWREQAFALTISYPRIHQRIQGRVSTGIRTFLHLLEEEFTVYEGTEPAQSRQIPVAHHAQLSCKIWRICRMSDFKRYPKRNQEKPIDWIKVRS